MKLGISDTQNYFRACLRGASARSWPPRSGVRWKEAEARKRCRLSTETWSESTLSSGEQTCARMLDVGGNGAPVFSLPSASLGSAGVNRLFSTASHFIDDLFYMRTTCLQKTLLGKASEVSNTTSRLCKKPHLFLVSSDFSASPIAGRVGVSCAAHAGGPEGFRGVQPDFSDLGPCVWPPCRADGS